MAVPQNSSSPVTQIQSYNQICNNYYINLVSYLYWQHDLAEVILFSENTNIVIQLFFLDANFEEPLELNNCKKPLIYNSWKLYDDLLKRPLIFIL